MAGMLEGTRIATPEGPVAVQWLRVGDKVLTQEGRLRSIRWIGSRAVDPTRHPSPATVLPVLFRAHAFGANLPARDLFLAPGQKIAYCGAVARAGVLRNGDSVATRRLPRLRYFDLTLDAPATLLAEQLGVVVEEASRADFADSKVVRLYPRFDAEGDPGPGVAQARSRLRDVQSANADIWPLPEQQRF